MNTIKDILILANAPVKIDSKKISKWYWSDIINIANKTGFDLNGFQKQIELEAIRAKAVSKGEV